MHSMRLMVNCFYYEKSLENDTITILIKLELVNTMPEVYLSAHANTLSKLHVKFKLGCILTDLSTGVGP